MKKETELMNIMLCILDAVLVTLFIFYDWICSLWPEKAMETSHAQKK